MRRYATSTGAARPSSAASAMRGTRPTRPAISIATGDRSAAPCLPVVPAQRKDFQNRQPASAGTPITARSGQVSWAFHHERQPRRGEVGHLLRGGGIDVGKRDDDVAGVWREPELRIHAGITTRVAYPPASPFITLDHGAVAVVVAFPD